MELNNDIIKQRLIEKFGEQLTQWEETYGIVPCHTTAVPHKTVN